MDSVTKPDSGGGDSSEAEANANPQPDAIETSGEEAESLSEKPSLQGLHVPVRAAPNPIPIRKEHKRSCLHGAFATRQLSSGGNQSLYVKIELLIYIVYLVIIVILVIGMTSGTTYYYTRVMADLFVDVEVISVDEHGSDPTKTFVTSSDVRDFWNYIRNPMIDGIYWEAWSAGSSMNLKLKDLTDKEQMQDGIMYENRLIGSARLRQVRVRNVSCIIERTYPHLNRECFPEYSKKFEDTGEYNNCSISEPNKKCWGDATLLTSTSVVESWQFKEGGFGHSGKLGSYSGNGGEEIMKKTAAEAAQNIGELQTNLWITRATRAIFLDFTVYNPNINLFCVVKLIWEFPATGGLTTSHSLRTVRLIRYLRNFDYHVILPCEILFCTFTLYFLIQEIAEMFYLGCKEYLQDIWSWLDLTTLALSFTYIGFSIYRLFLVRQTLHDLTKPDNDFEEFEYLAYWETQFNHTVSVGVFLAFIKLFKYVSSNNTMAQLSRTLSRCAKDVFGFALMFFIVFVGFALFGYLVFSSQLEEYSTLQDTIVTLFRLVMGDFDFHALSNANRIMGPIFFIAYTFFIFFVLLNMFLAIINDTFSVIKVEIQAQKQETELPHSALGMVQSVKGVYGDDRKLEAEAAAKLAAADGKITQEEVRANLQRYNYNLVEVEMFLARYDLDQERVLAEDEAQHVLDDMWGTGDDVVDTQKMELNEILENYSEDYGISHAAGRTQDFKRTEGQVESIQASLAELLRQVVQMNQLLKSRKAELEKQ